MALPILVFLVFSMKPTKSNSVFQPGSSIKKKFGVSTKTLQTRSDTGKLETVRLPGGKLFSTPCSTLNTSSLGAEQIEKIGKHEEHSPPCTIETNIESFY